MSQQPFGDVPFFRELQRLLASGGGPINLEIAGQIAHSIAGQRPDPPAEAQARPAFDGFLHEAEALLAGYTRLAPDEPLRGSVYRRADWVDRTLAGWRWVFQQLGARFGSPGGENADTALAPVLEQISPLLLGMQAGTLVGQLSLEALTRYDLPIPRDDDQGLFLVDTNVTHLAGEYGFEVDALRRWLAYRDAARHLIARSVPWSMRYLRSLMTELIDSIEIDMSELERRLSELQAGGFQLLEQGVSADRLVPIAESERHTRARRNVRGFLAAFEGYAIHAHNSVAAGAGAADSRIDEAMTRRVASPSEGQTMLAALLGVERDRSLENAGATFCAAVVKLRGIDELNKVWAAADNLPSLDEIRDPFAWMDRVLDEPAIGPEA